MIDNNRRLAYSPRTEGPRKEPDIISPLWIFLISQMLGACGTWKAQVISASAIGDTGGFIVPSGKRLTNGKDKPQVLIPSLDKIHHRSKPPNHITSSFLRVRPISCYNTSFQPPSCSIIFMTKFKSKISWYNIFHLPNHLPKNPLFVLSWASAPHCQIILNNPGKWWSWNKDWHLKNEGRRSMEIVHQPQNKTEARWLVKKRVARVRDSCHERPGWSGGHYSVCRELGTSGWRWMAVWTNG